MGIYDKFLTNIPNLSGQNILGIFMTKLPLASQNNILIEDIYDRILTNIWKLPWHNTLMTKYLGDIHDKIALTIPQNNILIEDIYYRILTNIWKLPWRNTAPPPPNLPSPPPKKT